MQYGLKHHIIKIFDWYCDSRSPDAGVEVIRSFAKKLQPNSTVLDKGMGINTDTIVF